MGGGTAMRAAAKVAGIGVFNTGLRGGVVPDHHFSAAASKVARPVSAIAASSSTDTVNSAVVIDASSEGKSCWENDGWELTGGKEDILFGSGEPMPRVVFGGAPTLEEAKEATTNLSVALEKLYLSSTDSTGNEFTCKSTDLSPFSNPEDLESKPFINAENMVITAPPKHAIQAFKFLQESPAVQTVVASIACDPNVWNAVLLNPALRDYIQSQKMSTSFSNMHSSVEEYSQHSDILDPKSPRSFDVASETGKSDDGEANLNPMIKLKGFFQNLKGSVVDMVTSCSDFFYQTLFGVQPDDKASENTNSSANFFEKAWPTTVMGFVIMVIMVVLLKRV